MPNPDATQPSPQPAEDLERALAEIDDWHRYATDPQVDRDARTTAMGNLGDIMLDHWLPIRDEMRRERDEARQALLAAVREAGELHERAERAEAMLQQVTAVADALLHGHAHIGLVSADEIVAQAKRVQAALAAAQPAAEEGERVG